MDVPLPTVEKAPIFPLPEGALIPGDFLPLHVFEPRYRRMMEVVRGGDRMLAVATILHGWEDQAAGDPPLASIVGLGRVVKDRLNSDGTSDIVVHGLTRAEIVSESEGEPFRQARLLLHTGDELHPAEMYRLRRELLSALAQRLRSRTFHYDVTAGFDVGALVDRIASSLELKPAERVAVVQSVDLTTRMQQLLELTSQRRHRQRLLDIIPSLHAFSLSVDPGGGKENPR